MKNEKILHIMLSFGCIITPCQSVRVIGSLVRFVKFFIGYVPKGCLYIYEK